MVKLKKTQTETYNFKSDNPYWWASINISDDGFLNIQSDYGNYNYCWSAFGNSFGNSFKKFLVDCNSQYIRDKLGIELEREFDSETTEKAIKKEIISMLRCKDISSENARECWNIANKIKRCISQHEFYDLIYYKETEILHHIYFGDVSTIPVYTNVNSRLQFFMDIIWPEFIKELKSELQI